MVIDCDSCAVRGLACEDCVVSVVLGAPAQLELDSAQCRAIDALAGAGMVPRLRLVPAPRAPEGDHTRYRGHCAERSIRPAERSFWRTG